MTLHRTYVYAFGEEMLFLLTTEKLLTIREYEYCMVRSEAEHAIFVYSVMKLKIIKLICANYKVFFTVGILFSYLTS